MKTLREIVPLNEKTRYMSRKYKDSDFEFKAQLKNLGSRTAGMAAGGLAGIALTGNPVGAIAGSLAGGAIGDKFARHAIQDKALDKYDELKAKIKSKWKGKK